MNLLKSQTIYTTSVSIGASEDEAVGQAFFFDKGFIPYAVVVRFISISTDPLHDVKFRCEIHPARGSEFLADFTENPIVYSEWYPDDKISASEFTFMMPEIEVNPGAYYFFIVPNGRVPCGASLAIYDHGDFWGNFIKKEFETGTYRKDTSLMIKIYGTWISSGIQYGQIETNSYVTTILRDEQSK